MRKSIILGFLTLLLVGCANTVPVSDSTSEENGMTTDEKENFFNGIAQNSIEGESYGVGKGINVLKAEYIDSGSIIGSSNIFDANKILSKEWVKINENKGEIHWTQSTTANDYYTQRNQGFEKKFNVSGYVPTDVVGVPGTFTASIEKGIATGKEFSESGSDKEVITHFFADVRGYTVGLTGYRSAENFIDALSEDFLDDLDRYCNDEITAEKLFNDYGTHVIMSGIYGGRYDITHHLMYHSKNSNQYSETTIKNNIKLGLDLFIAGATTGEETNINFSNISNISIEGKYESATFTVQGGKTFDATNFEQFHSNFKQWLESLDSISGKYSTLIDLPDESLLPIWAFIPDNHSNKAEELGNKFYELGGAKESQFNDKYLREYHEEVQPENILITLRDKIKSCELDKGYNPDIVCANELAVKEAQAAIDIADMKLNGCRKVFDENNNFVGYKIIDNNNFGFDFITKQDPKNLALTNPVPSGSNIKKIEIANDNARYLDSVGNLQKQFGKGAVYYEYTYPDGTKSIPEPKYSIYNNVGKGQTIKLGSSSDFYTNQTTISSLKIIYVFELNHLNRIWLFNRLETACYTNWRVDLTLNFIND